MPKAVRNIPQRALASCIETGFNACKVKWDDPSNGDVSLLHFTEMANIGLGPADW